MNITTSGCGNCMYCYNGQCSYGGQCYGSPQLQNVNGKWCWMPIGSFIVADISDVSGLQKECESKEEAYNRCYSDYRYWKDKAKEYKHRAEVAEAENTELKARLAELRGE